MVSFLSLLVLLATHVNVAFAAANCSFARVELATSAWPIMHSNAFNTDAFTDDTPLDTTTTFDVGYTPLRTLPEYYRNYRPLAPLSSAKKAGRWWISGELSVFTVVETSEKPYYENELGVASVNRQPVGFGGAYSFVSKDEALYRVAGLLFEKVTVAKDAKKKLLNRLEKETKNMREVLPDSSDSLVALSVTPASGRVVLTTSQGYLLTPACDSDSSASVDDWTWSVFDVYGAVDDPIKDSTFKDYSRDGIISNSHACLQDTAYVPLAIGLAAVDLSGADPVLATYWPVPPHVSAAFDPSDPSTTVTSQFLNRLGPFGTGSSPTVFETSSKRFATITDGRVSPMRLWVFDLDDTQQAPIVANVTFGASPFSTSEQSVSVFTDDATTASIVVVNNYAGVSNFDVDDPNLWSTTGADLALGANWVANTTQGQSQFAKGNVHIAISPVVAGACAAGVNRYDLDLSQDDNGGQGTNNLKLRWSNVDVCSQTSIPLQTQHRVWVVGSTRDDPTNVGLVALDRDTGDLDLLVPLPDDILPADASVDPLKAFDLVLGIPNLDVSAAFGVDNLTQFDHRLVKNIQYADVETDGDAILFGTVGGLVRVVPTSSSS